MQSGTLSWSAASTPLRSSCHSAAICLLHMAPPQTLQQQQAEVMVVMQQQLLLLIQGLKVARPAVSSSRVLLEAAVAVGCFTVCLPLLTVCWAGNSCRCSSSSNSNSRGG